MPSDTEKLAEIMKIHDDEEKFMQDLYEYDNEEEARIGHRPGDMTEGSMWRKWLFSEDELTFEEYCTRYN